MSLLPQWQYITSNLQLCRHGNKANNKTIVNLYIDIMQFIYITDMYHCTSSLLHTHGPSYIRHTYISHNSYIQGQPQEERALIVLCKTCSMLLCVLEQQRVDNSSAGPNWLMVGLAYIHTVKNLKSRESLHNFGHRDNSATVENWTENTKSKHI